MISIKYKCLRCNHEFYPKDDFNTNCPNCKNTDVEAISSEGIFSGISQYFKENKRSSLIILIVILLLIILIKCSKSCKSEREKNTFSIEFIQGPDYIEVIFKEFESKKITSLKPKISSLISAFNFSDKNGNRIIFKDINKIYPCESGEYVIYWKDSKLYPLINPSILNKIVNFPSDMWKANIKANCRKYLTDILVEFPGNCIMLIKTNLDSDPSVPIMISVTGRDGKYEKKLKWDAKNMRKLDVWGYIEGDDTAFIKPIPCQRNNDIVSPSGCKQCTPQDRNNLKDNLIKIANAYGNSPSNISLLTNFKNIILSSPNLKVYLNSKLLSGGISELENNLRIQYNNEGRKFQIDTKNILIDNSCVIQSISFKSIN